MNCSTGSWSLLVGLRTGLQPFLSAAGQSMQTTESDPEAVVALRAGSFLPAGRVGNTRSGLESRPLGSYVSDSKMRVPLHTRIADGLARLGALARFHENQKSQAEGLSPLQARALVVLQRRRGIRLGDLARELLVTYGTLSPAVSSLEEKALVTKYVDPEEHRAVNLELTRKGAAAARRVEGWASELLAPPVADLDADEAATLLASLLKLIRAFERRGTITAARMCFTCRYFDPKGGKGARPYFCNLLEEPIGEANLRIDCSEHEPADTDQLEGRRQA